MNQTKILLHIRDNTWTYSKVTNGVQREFVNYEFVLDATRTPPTLDLRYRLEGILLARPGTLGIIKLEGDTLIYCFVNGSNPNPIRPKQFDDNPKLPTGAVKRKSQRVK